MIAVIDYGVGNLFSLCRSLEAVSYTHLDVYKRQGYYSGIVFRGFLKNLSAGVLSGGQYDKMVEKMGKPLSLIHI